MTMIRVPGSAALVTLTSLLSALLSPALFSTTGTAQSPKLAKDVQYIRGLVKDLRFIDFAQSEVAGLKKIYKDSDDFKLVAQLDIEVALQGAKRHPDRKTRRALYKTALEQSANFIERYSDQDVAMDARTTLADACIEFGSFLNEELEIARDESPDSVKELEEEAAEVFQKGKNAAKACQDAFNEKDRKIDAFVAWMRRGILIREHGRAVKADREYLTKEAIEVFEELILEVGEETILGQRALFEMSKIEEVRGDFDAAISSYDDAIDAIYESLNDEDIHLPENAQRMMFTMMQEVLDRKASICLKQGKRDEVLATVKLCRDRIAEFKTEGHKQFFDSLLLSEAQVQSNSGQQAAVSEALKNAKAINERHPTDYVGIKAKNLIRSIMAKSSGLVTGALLLEVANGDYQLKKYDLAIAGFKRALNRMDTASKKKLGFVTWEKVGRSNQRMQRNLEAAICYARALEDHGADMRASDNPDAGEKLKSVVRRAASCLSKVMADSGKDPVFGALKQRIDVLVPLYDQSVATARDYITGLRHKIAGEYPQAIEAFFSVKESFGKYELAIGHGIECLFRANKYGEAQKKIAWYRDYVKNTELSDDQREKRGYRPQALAWTHYAEGRILYETARGKDGKPDITKFGAVEKHFLVFETSHSKNAQIQMVKVHEMLGHAYLEMGEDAKATARYNQLKELGATLADAHKFLGIKMFNSYSDRIRALQTEITAEARGGKDTTASAGKLKSSRNQALTLGMDYAKSIGRPSYAILYGTMRLAERLEEWEKCEKTAERILKLYPNSKKKSFRQVKPLLGFALLRQSGRMREALDILNKAETELAEGTKKAAYYYVRRYKALALGGWPAFDKDGINFQPNRGLSKPAEAYSLMWGKEYKKFALNSHRVEKYSVGWYRFYLEVYYFASQAQREDDKFRTRARTLFRIAASTDNFATLKAYGDEGKRIYNLFRMIK